MEMHVVFDGPPGPEPGRFVDVEDREGRSFSVGEWVEQPDGMWSLKLKHFTHAQLNLLAACLKFCHLTRRDFYDYVTDQGHAYLVEQMEELDVNELLRDLTNG